MSRLSKRPHHAFLSYSRKDGDIARKIRDWLKDFAGFQVWFDENQISACSPITTILAEQMSACRAWIVLVSKNSVSSPWVKAERDQALHCATMDQEFSLIVLRIDDCPLDQEWPAMARFKWLDVPGGVLTAAMAREIIDRLDGRKWSGRLTGLRTIYVSHGLRNDDQLFADAVCEGLCAGNWLVRLVGDAVDQPTFDERRIRNIIAGSSGHLLILPRRVAGPPSGESHYRINRSLPLIPVAPQNANGQLRVCEKSLNERITPNPARRNSTLMSIAYHCGSLNPRQGPIQRTLTLRHFGGAVNSVGASFLSLSNAFSNSVSIDMTVPASPFTNFLAIDSSFGTLSLSGGNALMKRCQVFGENAFEVKP